jgi:hypothetical protein
MKKAHCGDHVEIAGLLVFVLLWRSAADEQGQLRAGHRPAGLLTELFLSPLDAAGTSRLAEEVSGWPPPESDAEA